MRERHTYVHTGTDPLENFTEECDASLDSISVGRIAVLIASHSALYHIARNRSSPSSAVAPPSSWENLDEYIPF